MIRALWIGCSAGLAADRWLASERLAILIGGLPGNPKDATGQAHLAIKTSHVVLRIARRLPVSKLQNTCLYRSVAECLVLRRFGVPHRLVLGVQEGGDEGIDVRAHAWVDRSAAKKPSEPYVPLERIPVKSA